MNKKVIVIGAGIGGLSAGCYAAMNGYDVSILEAHNQPGGLCTSWKRKGYTIDGSCHWVTGSAPGHALYPMWEELGALKGRKIVDYDYFVRLTGTDGRVFTMYTNLDRLESHMNNLSPADSEATATLCSLVRKFAGFAMPVGKAAELMGPMDGLKMLWKFRPFMKIFKELGAITLEQFAAKFKDPLLRDGIKNAMSGASLSLFPLVMSLGPMSRKQAGFPIGGSLALARGIEARFRSLGGTVTYKARVEKVLEEDGKARGVRLTDGTEVLADYVISACDMQTTLRSFVDGGRMDPVHKELFDTQKVIDPCVQVSFGVNRDFSDVLTGMTDSFKLASPITIGGRQISWFNAKSYCYDPSMAPAGKSLLMSMFLTDWSFWEKLKDDPAAYAAEKERTIAACAQALECRYPGFTKSIEMSDMATPLTYVRYTGNWKGTYMTWDVSGDFRRRHPYIPHAVPGLENFYMASMWTDAPGGLPGAAMAGRNVAQLLCAKDRKGFVTTKA
jgi:phytoene dehydrogenase-like protein